MSFTPFNAPLLSGLFADMEVAGHFSVKADLGAMLRFESALAKAQGNLGIISKEAADDICAKCEAFEPDVKRLSEATPRDGLVVPELIKQLREVVGAPHSQHVHFGATSQDVIDTALVLRLVQVVDIFKTRLDALSKTMTSLENQFGANPLMGRTRMQAALPITVRDRISLWHHALNGHQTRLDNLENSLLKIQLAGPVGTLEKMADKGQTVRDEIAKLLELSSTKTSWHTDRSSLGDFTHWMSLVTGTLGKMGQDIALMAQQGIDEVSIKGGGSSSAMPHKQNPVKAEALVTLAKFCATQSGGFYQALIHEQERSGVTWTLEWMLLPSICVATGASLRVANELLESITELGSKT